MFTAITNALANGYIPRENVIALVTDDAGTMLGKVSGLYVRLSELQGSLCSVWCICHLAHLVAEKATDVFPTHVQTLPVEIFYYFKKSYQRSAKLKEIQIFCETVEHKLLKPSGTRWLAMRQISGRLCEDWDALKAYFNSEPTDWVYANDVKRRRLNKLRRDKVHTKMLDDDHHLSYMFCRDTLPMFTRFNQFFQTSGL